MIAQYVSFSNHSSLMSKGVPSLYIILSTHQHKRHIDVIRDICGTGGESLSCPAMSSDHHPFSYYVGNKPYGMLCQFSDSSGRPTLAGIGKFPKDVYPAGRLDLDSEGLVLLTNDGMLKHVLLDPRHRHPRTYLVQVERIPDERAIRKLCDGVVIEKQKTMPAKVKLLDENTLLPDRDPPIRFRKHVPTAWLEIILVEGRNRQIRKMTANVGHPTLRLIRSQIMNIRLDNIAVGSYRELSPAEIQILRRSLGLS